ncbi:MAG: winged helix-turn-helix transcriptional regulator [Actinobacteria bacterium]|nr:winged helix-turn-helix transcriptional regulator [Actinomycetota bacterium]
MDPSDCALICKALGDSNRMQIVRMLSEGEKCACKLLEKFDITQPTLSHHMKILCECGIVSVRKDGKWAYYSLDDEVFGAFGRYIASLGAASVASAHESDECCS